jgi:RimJ/RimL family protein N-acetyltransferase
MPDVWKQLENYRKLKILPSGERLLLRPLTKEDEGSLVALFAGASDQDLQYFRSDAGDPEVVRGWVRDLNLKRVFPLVAMVDDRMVGEAMLHFGEHFHRHLAWVRIFLDQGYRRQGIGTLMLRCLIDIARRVGLQQLYAEVVLTQPQVVKAFENLGFRHEVTLEDYFITDRGDTLDMAILVFWLVDNSGVF